MSQKMRFAIVVSRFNELITAPLAEGARKYFLRNGVPESSISVIEVPGSFELPLAAQWCLEQPEFDGVVALGAVIQGSTDHYNYVCSGVTNGIMNVQLQKSKPVGFGVLTCETLEQALDRAGGKLGNKGAETAATVFEMVQLKRKLKDAK